MGCIHSKTEDIIKKVVEKDSDGNVLIVLNEFAGYRHFCDKCPKAYDEWKTRNASKTYDECKEDVLPCFEPCKTTKSLHKMNELVQEILQKMGK